MLDVMFIFSNMLTYKEIIKVVESISAIELEDSDLSDYAEIENDLEIITLLQRINNPVINMRFVRFLAINNKLTVGEIIQILHQILNAKEMSINEPRSRLKSFCVADR